MTPRSELSAVNDSLLLERCRNGDHHAYGLIVERYQTLVCSVAYNRCGDFSLSEDLAQEAFLMAWEKLADLRDATRFKAWICSIVRNLTSRAAKRQRRSVTGKAAQLDAATDLSAKAESPDERAVSAEEGQLVWQAIESIPEMYREPLVLYYREELSVARVAESLDLSHDAVKQRLSRGRRMLQNELAATVQKTLAKTKPSAAFTVAVLAGLSQATATNAVAAGVAASTLAKTASSGLVKASIGSAVGIPILALLAQLPVLRWIIKLSFDQSRSDRERQLLKRFYAINGCVTLLFAAAAFSSIWWDNFLPIPADSVFRGLLIPGMMIFTYIPLFWSTYRYNRQVKQLREEEGTATPPRPLCKAANRAVSLSKTYRIFLLSGLSVIAWPAALAIRAADCPVLGGVLALTVTISLLASWISQRISNYEFQCYVLSVCLTMFLGIAVVWCRRDVWTPGINGIAWSFVVLMGGMSTTGTVLTLLVWKRIHGRPNGSDPSDPR